MPQIKYVRFFVKDNILRITECRLIWLNVANIHCIISLILYPWTFIYQYIYLSIQYLCLSIILYLHNFHFSLVGFGNICEKSARRKTIKLRGICAYLVENFCCCWSSSNNFLAVSLSPCHFIFFYLCIAARSKYPFSLSSLSFFEFSYDENCCSCSYITRKIGVENAREYLVFKLFFCLVTASTCQPPRRIFTPSFT